MAMSASMQRANVQMSFQNAPLCPFYARNARKNQSAFKHASPLRNSLASAVGDGQSRFQIPTRIHQTPLVFPFLAWLIETLFPGLVESFEPRTIKAH